MYNYDQPIFATYSLSAANLSSAGVRKTVRGPLGRAGRVLGIVARVTTGVTVAASTVTVGANGEADPATLSVPVSGVGAFAQSTQANTEGKAELPADTDIEIATGGEATAGAADLDVIIGWF